MAVSGEWGEPRPFGRPALPPSPNSAGEVERVGYGRGAFRVMGICKTSIMVAVFAAATNLRLLRAWAKRTLGTDDLIPLLAQLAGYAPTPR